MKRGLRVQAVEVPKAGDPARPPDAAADHRDARQLVAGNRRVHNIRRHNFPSPRTASCWGSSSFGWSVARRGVGTPVTGSVPTGDPPHVGV